MAMSLGIGIGLPFGGAAAAASGTSASRYSVAGTSFRWPTTSATQATNTFFAVEFIFATPDYAVTDPRVFCPTFWSPSAGGETYIAGGASITIQGWSIETSSGVWTSCDGASGSGIATLTNASAGEWLPRVAATLTANTVYKGRLTFQVSGTSIAIPRQTAQSGASSPAGQERVEGSTTTRFARLSDNATLSNSGGIFYKPSMMIALGGDGRQAILVLGDSIAFGSNMTSANAMWTARNEFGYIACGLDSTADSSRRLAYHIMAIPGQRPVGSSGWDVAANWSGKRAALQAVFDQYGAWPFDRVINQHIRNSIPAAASLRTLMNVYYDLLTTTWGKPIVQIEALTGTSSTDGYATLVNQTPEAGFVYGSTNEAHAWPFNADVGGADGLGDASAYWRANGYIVDSIAPWRLMAGDLANDRDIAAVRSYSSTLSSAYVSGVSVSTVAAPTVGTTLYMLQDAGGYGTAREVTAVTGSGPYTVTLSGSPGTAAAGGNIIREGWGDGVHPSGIMHRDVLAPAITAWKAARGM